MTDRLHRLRTALWLLPVPLGATLVSAFGWRGHNLWSIWQVDAVRRVHAAAGRPSGEARALLEEAPRLFPLPAWLASGFGEGNEELALRILVTLAVGATVACTGIVAARAHSRPAGFLAGLLLLLCAPFLAVATTSAPTIFSLAGFAGLLAALAWSEGKGVRVLAVIPPLVVCLYSGLVGWAWLIPLFLVLFWDGGETSGEVRIRPASLASLAVIPVAIVAGMLVLPGLAGRGVTGLGGLLRAWLTLPSEPWLYFGHLWGRERMPVLAGIIGVAIRVPLVVLVAAGIAAFRAERPRNAVLWLFLGASFVAVYVLATPYNGAHDLLCFPLVPLCALAGIGLAELIRTPVDRRSRVLATGLVALALALSAMGLRASKGVWEAEYNVLVGQTEGATSRGFSRAWRAPLPAALLADLPVGDEGTIDIAIPINAWELRPVIAHGVASGSLDPRIRIVDRTQAAWLLVKWEDSAGEAWELAPQLRALRDAGRVVRDVRVGDVVVFEVVDVRR